MSGAPELAAAGLLVDLLATVKAEAWDEGVEAAFQGMIVRQGRSAVLRVNPYRTAGDAEPMTMPDPYADLIAQAQRGERPCTCGQPWRPDAKHRKDGACLLGAEYALATNPSMGVAMTPERLASLVEAEPCPTCSGPVRRTVGMVCQTCGKDYAPREGDADDLPGMWERADIEGGKP